LCALANHNPITCPSIEANPARGGAPGSMITRAICPCPTASENSFVVGAPQVCVTLRKGLGRALRRTNGREANSRTSAPLKASSICLPARIGPITVPATPTWTPGPATAQPGFDRPALRSERRRRHCRVVGGQHRRLGTPGGEVQLPFRFGLRKPPGLSARLPSRIGCRARLSSKT